MDREQSLAMATTSDEPGTLFAPRLDRLFRTVHPQDRGPYSHAEVAEAINRAAGKMGFSASYVWQLRTGYRDNPTMRHLSALAAFFGVSPMYFFPDAEADRDGGQAELIPYLKNDGVRDLVLRTAGLSGRSLQAIRAMVERARLVEGVPEPDPVPGGKP